MTGAVRDKPVFRVVHGISLAGHFWYWVLESRNGKEIGVSVRHYTRRRDCVRAIDTVLMAIFDASVEVEK